MRFSFIFLMVVVLSSCSQLGKPKPYQNFYAMEGSVDKVEGLEHVWIEGNVGSLFDKKKYYNGFLVLEYWQYMFYFTIKDSVIITAGIQNKLYSKKWVFPKSVVFRIGDKIERLNYKSTKTDTGGDLYDSTIVGTYVHENSHNLLDKKMITILNDIVNSKEAIVRFSGQRKKDYECDTTIRMKIKAFLNALVREYEANGNKSQIDVEYIKTLGYDGRVIKSEPYVKKKKAKKKRKE